MFRLLIVLFLTSFATGCIGSLEDLLDIPYLDEGEEECWYDGGTTPKKLATPEGHSYQCDNKGYMYLGSEGNYEDSEDTGKWVVSYSDRFCIRYDPQDECLYSCQSFTHVPDINSLIFRGHLHFWRKEGYLGGSEQPDTCILIEE